MVVLFGAFLSKRSLVDIFESYQAVYVGFSDVMLLG